MATIDLTRMMGEMNAYAIGLQREADAAAERIAQYVHQRTVNQARQDASWQGIADEIELWSQDGKYIVGLKDQELASQAFQIEYGDEFRAPSPLFRLAGRDLSEAYQQARVGLVNSGYGSYM